MKKKVLLAAVLVGLLLLQAVFAALAEGQPALSLDPAEITLDKGEVQKAFSQRLQENEKKYELQEVK